MRDKYNLNTLPAGMQEADGYSAAMGAAAAEAASAASEAVPSVPSIIPGMAPEDRVAPSFHKVSMKYNVYLVLQVVVDLVTLIF